MGLHANPESVSLGYLLEIFVPYNFVLIDFKIKAGAGRSAFYRRHRRNMVALRPG